MDAVSATHEEATTLLLKKNFCLLVSGLFQMEGGSAIGRFFASIANWLRSLFWKQEMELTLVGLQASGKTTLVNLISGGSLSGGHDSHSGLQHEESHAWQRHY